MEVSYTLDTWNRIIDTIANRRMTFATGHHERAAYGFAQQLMEDVLEAATDEDDLITIDFGDNWDAYLIVNQAAIAS